jgi:hypothetical protein
MAAVMSRTRRRRGKCDSCQLVSIQGVMCHELGCPAGYIDPSTGKGYVEQCIRCGSNFCIKFKGQRVCHRHR